MKKKIKVGSICFIPALARYGKVSEVRADGRIVSVEVPKLPEQLPQEDVLLEEIDLTELIVVVNLVVELVGVIQNLIRVIKKIKIGKKNG